MSRDEEAKKELTETVRENVDSAIKDTPLEKVASYLDPPPPPVATAPITNEVVVNLNPTTNEQGTTQQPVSPALDPTTPVGTVIEPVQEDSVVPMTFVDDAAQWMASRYVPGKGLRFSFAATNYRYGQTMRGLMPASKGGDVISARGELLRYAFNPSMLSALYNLYADRFVAALGDAAEFPNKGKALTPEQTNDMYRAYAKQFQSLSGVLQGIANTPDIFKQVQNAEDLGQESVDIHSKITSAVFDLDQARENKDETAENAAQLRIDGLNAQYQRVLAERNQASRGIATTIQQKAPAARGVDADTIIFIAEWVERRQKNHTDALATTSTAASILQDLATRLNTAASN